MHSFIHWMLAVSVTTSLGSSTYGYINSHILSITGRRSMWKPPRTVTCHQIRPGQCRCQGQPGWNLVLVCWSKYSMTSPLPSPSFPTPPLRETSKYRVVFRKWGEWPLPISVLHLVVWVTKIHWPCAIVQPPQCSVQFSCSVVSDSLWPHEPQHARPPCPSPLLEFTQTHVHRVGDTIQPSHLLLSPSPPAFNLSQHQGLFKWVSSSHQVAKILELQLQNQSFQWIPRTDFL